MSTQPVFVGTFRIGIARKEILRLLGAGRKGGPLREDTLKMIQEAEALGRELIEPQGVYRILERPETGYLSPLRDHDRAALAICTIGSRLEEKVKELMATGREPEGYILDAVGSVAAEAAADVVNAGICHWAEDHGLAAAPRFSPGYGDWSLEEQREIFRLLPAGQIGMHLNPSCMMIPRKSVSFAVRFVEAGEQPPSGNPCDRCGLENCPFRKKKKEPETETT
jgi:hypothetical protein